MNHFAGSVLHGAHFGRHVLKVNCFSTGSRMCKWCGHQNKYSPSFAAFIILFTSPVVLLCMKIGFPPCSLMILASTHLRYFINQSVNCIKVYILFPHAILQGLWLSEKMFTFKFLLLKIRLVHKVAELPTGSPFYIQ